MMPRTLRAITKTAKRLFIGVLGLILIAVVAGNIYRLQGRAKLHREFHPPGRMVDIGTHRMHIHCVGSGRPTVVLDAGGGGYSSAWTNVMQGAASITRVCAFDRSGMGWSERGPGPVSAQSRNADLEALLAASEELGPYIFAGGSLGGGLAWLFAQSHLDEAAGLIAVDAMPPNMDDIAALRGGHPEPTPDLVWLDRLGLLPAAQRLLSLSGDAVGFDPSVDPFLSEGLIDEVDSFSEIGHAARRMSGLGGLPLIVITHGRPGSLMDQWGDRKDEAEAMWQQSQKEMAAQSSEGRLVVAQKSDHNIPMNQPDVVVQAIRDLTERFREGRERAQETDRAMQTTAVDGGELATIGRTEQFLVRSDRAGADFLIQVATPNLTGPGGGAGPWGELAPDHLFPVIYVTDGGGLFPLAAVASRNPEGMVEPAFVVGITYPEDLDPEGGNNWRMRDLMHTANPLPFPDTPPGTPPPGNMPPVIGEGAAFEAFLLEELRSLIESRYPIDPDRSVLVGHSLGGTFTAMVLSPDPGAFAGYIIGSPGMWLEPDLAERVASVAPDGDGGKVFIGVGELESPFVPMADELEAALTAPDSAFDVRRETFADEGHTTVPFVLLTRGLRHVLPGPAPRGGFAAP